MIDREKVIENEHNEIENMLQEFEKTHNLTLINRIIQRFENNRTTGYRQKCEEKYKNEFPLRNSDEYLSLESLVTKLTDVSKENENNTRFIPANN